MRLDFALCVNDGFAEYIGVTVKSICVNHPTEEVHIHVLTDYISPKRRRTLLSIVSDHPNVHIDVVEVDDSKLRGLKDTWSIYTWYRVLIPALLPECVHRILYLDADTLVTDNLTDLFTMDMTGVAIACAMDIMALDNEPFARCGFAKEKVYVCAGVMLMNLDFWRENDLSERIIRFGFENDAVIRFPDQDTINILCQDTKIVLPMRYGVQEGFFTDKRMAHEPWAAEVRECRTHPAIVHYAGCAPWVKEFDHTTLHGLWMQYSRMLRHPVRPKYKTKGWNGVKVRLYRWLDRLGFAPKKK